MLFPRKNITIPGKTGQEITKTSKIEKSDDLTTQEN